MRFCKKCQSILKKSSTTAGEIVFLCVCGEQVQPGADDTLMYEINFESALSNDKHESLIANAPYDNARNLQSKYCICGMDVMTLIRIGGNTLYVCSCGHKISHSDYEKMYDRIA